MDVKYRKPIVHVDEGHATAEQFEKSRTFYVYDTEKKETVKRIHPKGSWKVTHLATQDTYQWSEYLTQRDFASKYIRSENCVNIDKP